MHATGEDIVRQMTMVITKDRSMKVEEGENSLMIKDDISVFAGIEALLKTLDNPDNKPD